MFSWKNLNLDMGYHQRAAFVQCGEGGDAGDEKRRVCEVQTCVSVCRCCGCPKGDQEIDHETEKANTEHKARAN